MKIPNTLPVTAEQSRAARFQLGLTQADLIQQSELPGWKLKQFETGRFVPDIPFLEKLREFYASRKIQIDSAAPAEPKGTRELQQATVGRTVAGTMQTASMCLYISPDLTPHQMAQVFERMEANDERISELLAAPVQKGLFGGHTEETEEAARELFGAMAENFLLFRVLQGRNIVKATSESTDTQADLLAQFFAGSPAAALAVHTHTKPTATPAKTPPGDLPTAEIANEPEGAK